MKPRFVVNETDHLMPPQGHVDDLRAAWVRSGRADETFRYREDELKRVRQRQLLERLRAKHRKYQAG